MMGWVLWRESRDFDCVFLLWFFVCGFYIWEGKWVVGGGGVGGWCGWGGCMVFGRLGNGILWKGLWNDVCIRSKICGCIFVW